MNFVDLCKAPCSTFGNLMKGEITTTEVTDCGGISLRMPKGVFLFCRLCRVSTQVGHHIYTLKYKEETALY